MSKGVHQSEKENPNIIATMYQTVKSQAGIESQQPQNAQKMNSKSLHLNQLNQHQKMPIVPFSARGARPDLIRSGADDQKE